MVKLTNRQLSPTFQLIPDNSMQSKSLSDVSSDSVRNYFQISPTTGIITMRNSPNGTYYYSVCLKVSPKIAKTLSGDCGKLVILGTFSCVRTNLKAPNILMALYERWRCRFF